LGTEFGVEVDRDGQTSSYVFQGAVRLHPIAAAGDGGDLILQANQAGRIAPKKNRPASVSRVENVDSSKFVRRLTRRRIPIPVFSTGAIAKPGESDPHWQVAAMSNDPTFTPQPAIVAKHGNPKWTVDDSGESRWIMTVGEPVTNSKGETNQLFPRNGTTCVFRTAFELREVLPETAVLHGWFVVDDHIVAIRLNGRDCEVPEHVAVSSLFHKFTVRDGFIEGTNVLEIEVANSSVDFPPRSPLGLRAEFDGSVVQRH
jgi:hypothetical protein